MWALPKNKYLNLMGGSPQKCHVGWVDWKIKKPPRWGLTAYMVFIFPREYSSADSCKSGTFQVGKTGRIGYRIGA